MSSRRKGKPQQRILNDSGESQDDFVTCVSCHTTFPLKHMHIYINHKVNEMHKNNGFSRSIAVDGKSIDECDEGRLKIIEDISDDDASQLSITDELCAADKGERTAPHTKNSTGSSEPSKLTCATCKSIYSSSWYLLQHCQKAHKFRLMDDPNPTAINGRSNPDGTEYSASGKPNRKQTSPSQISHTNTSNIFSSPITLSQQSLWNLYNRPNDYAIMPTKAFEQFTKLTEPESRYSRALRQLAANPAPSANGSNMAAIGLDGQHPLSRTSSDNCLIVAPTPLKPGSQCDVCGKVYKFESNLLIHKCQHSGLKPYRCHMCAYQCESATKLQNHIIGIHLSLRGPTEKTNSDGDADHIQELSDESEVEEIDDTEENALLEQRAEAEITKLRQQHLRMAQIFPPVFASSTPLHLDETKRPVSSSLITEVMKNMGVENNELYRNALDAAIKDQALRTGDEDSEDGTDASKSPNSQITEDDIMESRLVRKRPSNTDKATPAKKIKTEPTEDDAAYSQANLLNGISMIKSGPSPSTYSTWYPPRVDSFNASQQLFVSPADSRVASGTTSTAATSNQTRLLNNNRNQPNKLHHILPSPSSSQPNSGTTSSPASSTARRRNDTCEYCGKVFKNCSNLTVHRRSHTGEKPYKCSLCSYACAQSSKLTRHMRTHGKQGNDTYHCKFCKMPFSVPSTLEKHMRKCMENQSAPYTGSVGNIKPESYTNSGDASRSPSNSDMPLPLDTLNAPTEINDNTVSKPLDFTYLSKNIDCKSTRAEPLPLDTLNTPIYSLESGAPRKITITQNSTSKTIHYQPVAVDYSRHFLQNKSHLSSEDEDDDDDEDADDDGSVDYEQPLDFTNSSRHNNELSTNSSNEDSRYIEEENGNKEEINANI